ncbi:MAG: ATP-binding protein [Dolichospermum sp. BR01]|nr:ATP-binding protein [Dolichospermum sp. BR01]
MKLDFVEYCEDKGKPSEWRLDGCQLGNVNLIVGKNASGKSRILKAINFISGLLCGDKRLRPDRSSREWILTFDSQKEDSKKVYILKLNNGQVVKESYIIGSKKYLDRKDSGEGEVWAEKLKTDIDFQAPTNELAAFHRRDSIQHPVFDDLYTWASSLNYYQFGTELDRRVFLTDDPIEEVIKGKYTDKTLAAIDIFKLGKTELGSLFIESIKSDMSDVGYSISEIGIQTPSRWFPDEVSIQGIKTQCLYVQESDLKDKTEQLLISQGMFRALSLIIQVNYSLLAGKPSCILIDDIGEGLDFERASAMIKLLISKAEAKSGLVQLIMTTNDRFIMNGVPLDYWSVIERQPGLAKLHNIHNSKEIFDDFKFTGLNNFDFFATQFYIEGFGNEENIEQ